MKFVLSHNDRILTLVDGDRTEKGQLQKSLTKKLEYYNFLPQQVKTKWNGVISYFHQEKYVPSGLWMELRDICKKYRFNLEIEGLRNLFEEIDYSDFLVWVDNKFEGAVNKKGETFIPRDYQIDSAYKIIKHKLSISELATSAGKSLIIYLAFSYLLDKGLAKRCLMIVPTINLVIQAFEDFHEYNSFLKPENRTPLEIKQIHGGESKEYTSDQNIFVGTFQSLVKFSDPFLSAFDTVAADECLHPDTLIHMADDTYKKISDIKEGELVYTTNDDTQNIEINEVDFVYENLSKNEQMYELELEDGRIIKITGNHKVKLTTGEYKRVDELTENDDILTF